VPTIAAAKQHVAGSTFDAILVDYDLDDGKGDELVRWLHATAVATKLIAVSARETGNAKLVAVGADAICAKTAFARIAAVLHEVVGAS
jgi:DNA-binding response OmpR family regulator